MTTRCARFADVDAHFAGRLAPAAETRLRGHLTDCQPCRGRYGRHLQLEALDPSALPFATRLAIGLGVRRRPRPFPLWAPGLAALAAGIFLLLPRPHAARDEFHARGGAPGALVLALDGAGTEVLGFRTGGGGSALATHLGRTDELAFAYRNAGGWSHLLVFARDERGGVYWFQPAWTEAASDPVAVPLSTAPGLHELPTAVGHSFHGQRLALCALASRTPLSVRQVEATLSTAPAAPAQALGALGAAACRELEVEP